MIVHLFVMVVLLGLSGFFSASETALFSVRREDLRRLAESPGFVHGLILKLRADPQGLLTTVLFGNTLVNVLYFCLATAAALAASTQAAALAVGAGSFVAIIICGEVVPKAVAVAIPLRFSNFAAAPIFFFQKAILPIRKALVTVTKLSTAISGGDQQTAYVTPEELQLLIRATSERGQIAVTERDMMHEIMEFGETRVREVMVPRVDVVAFDAGGSVSEFRRLVEETSIAAIPVYEEDIDHIFGLVNARDVLLSNSQRVRDHVRPIPLFVPETARIEAVLHQFREQRCQFGVVVDEYGGCAGIVTLEDIVEEIVGDISDEFDVEKAKPVRQIAPDKFELSGGLSIRDWSELFGLDVDLAEVETLGGFIALRLGRLPSEGESVTLGNLVFTVLTVSRRRVTEVLIERVNGDRGAGK